MNNKQRKCRDVIFDCIMQCEMYNGSPDKQYALRGFYLCLGIISDNPDPVNGMLDILTKLFIRMEHSGDARYGFEVMLDAIEHSIIECEEVLR